jgi:23S rRNA (cytidine1920-2'-O)/16S rRNA (cytidine1409-2'-O)-methyltransferase
LDREILRRGLATTRTEAQRLITSGRVEVEGVAGPKPATLIDKEAVISVNQRFRYVGRGGEKLEAALNTFPVAVEERRALDVGASTGGFTDCLLQHGASHVVAVDVGHRQLHPRLRQDSRLELFEGLDIRHASSELLGGLFDLIVVDLAFISACLVAPTLAGLSAPFADLILLVKPQFEVGRQRIGKGVVRDPALRMEAVDKVAACLRANGFEKREVLPSPILGGEGNQEYLLWAVFDGRRQMVS